MRRFQFATISILVSAALVSGCAIYSSPKRIEECEENGKQVEKYIYERGGKTEVITFQNKTLTNWQNPQ